MKSDIEFRITIEYRPTADKQWRVIDESRKHGASANLRFSTLEDAAMYVEEAMEGWES